MTNSYKDLVPEDYIRKQTLANAERYTTPRLKELEDTILNAEDKLQTLEYDISAESGIPSHRNWYVSRILPRRLQSWMFMHPCPWCLSAITMYARS